MLDEALRALVKENRPYDIEFKIKRPNDGAVIDIHSNAVYNAGSRTIFGFIQDITERKKADEQYKTILKTAIDGFYMVDLEGKILDINDSYCSMIGYSRDELLKMSIHDIDVFDPPEVVKKRIEYIISTGPVFFETRHKCKDGKIIDIEASCSFQKEEKKRLFVFMREITERKKSEEKIRQLSEAVEQSPATIVITDKNGNIQYVNPMFTETTGYSADEAIGKNPRILKSGFTSESEYKKMWETIRSGKKWIGEFHNKKKNGEFYWESASVSPIIGVYGKILNYLAVKTDITERKKIEEALREASTYNRRLIEASIDPLVAIGQDGKITDVNTSTEQVTGYKREELIGTDFSDYFTEPEKAKAGYKQVFSNGKVYDYPLEMRNRNGHITPVVYNATIYEDNKGNIVGVFAAARDITERKKVEEEIKASEFRYRSLVEQASDAIFITDSIGIFIDVNPSCCFLLGYSREELLKISIFDLIFDEDMKKNPPRLDNIRMGETIQYERRFKKKDGTSVEVEVTGKRMIDGRHIIFVHDIAERKKQEEKIKASETRYRRLFE